MHPAFSGTYKPISVPFGNQVIAELPREHRLVKNGSFGGRFVEGTYIYSDSATPCIWMFSIALQRKIKVQDIKSYSLQYPFKDPKIHTHAQMCADENASNSHFLEPTDVDDDTNPPLHVLTQLCLLWTKQATTPHFCHPICHCAPPLVMI